MKNKRVANKKNKILNIIIMLIFFILLVYVFTLLFLDDDIKLEEVLVPELLNNNINDFDLSSYNVEYEYKYDEVISKDIVIEQSIAANEVINNDKLILTVSLGSRDKEEMSALGINELGRVPIVMYHGIIDVASDETGYTGGNVDVDGYKRTAQAFTEDLQFYYDNDYRMIRLEDYVDGIINVEKGKSPLVLTFDDGGTSNFNVLGKDDDGELIIDPTCAVGILESFKEKYSDYNVTATFFLNKGLFGQTDLDEEKINWLIENGYDIGNHSYNHANLSEITDEEIAVEIGQLYETLEEINENYVPIIALPFGNPSVYDEEVFSNILSVNYEGNTYDTISTLRVGWDANSSPFNLKFQKDFIMRVRAYDNNGSEFDLQMVFENLEETRFISDGEVDVVVVKEEDIDYINTDLEVITY